jgi:hypothetical protein
MSTYFCFGYLPSNQENYLFNPNFAHYVTASESDFRTLLYQDVFLDLGITLEGGGECVVHDGVVGMNNFGNFLVFEVGGLTIDILQDVFKIEIKKIFKSPSAQKTWK